MKNRSDQRRCKHRKERKREKGHSNDQKAYIMYNQVSFATSIKQKIRKQG